MGIVARFTARHRINVDEEEKDNSQFHEETHHTQAYIKALVEAKIPAQVLSQDEEADCGSLNAIKIAKKYLNRNVKKVLVIEGGKGSFQLVKYQLQKLKKAEYMRN